MQSGEWSICVNFMSSSTSTWKSLLLSRLPNLRSACRPLKKSAYDLEIPQAVPNTECIMYWAAYSYDLSVWIWPMASAQIKLWGKLRRKRHLEGKGLTMHHVLNLYLVCLHRTTSCSCTRLEIDPDAWNIGKHIHCRGNTRTGCFRPLSNFHYFALWSVPASIQFSTQCTHTLTKIEHIVLRSMSSCFQLFKGWKAWWWRAKNKAVTRAVWSIKLKHLPVTSFVDITSPLWCLTCEEEVNQAARSVLLQHVCV